MDMDPRLLVQYGKPGRKGKVVMLEPCVPQCVERKCPSAFNPDPPEADGLPRCRRYFKPAVWWESGKTCPTVYVASAGPKAEELNSSKVGKKMRRAARATAKK